MKLSKRLLAVLLSVAMLVGMVAIAANASITDYTDYDPVTNPYTVKFALKIFAHDAESGDDTEITKGTDGKYHVEPGQLIRVEQYLQTNYHANSFQTTCAYNNEIFMPTKNEANNFATYNYLSETYSGLYKKVVIEDETNWDSDGTPENPHTVSSGYTIQVAFAGGRNAAALKNAIPKSWQSGTSTFASYAFAKPEYQMYNFVNAGFATNLDEGKPASGCSVIYTTLTRALSYYITVNPDVAVGTEGKIFVPRDAARTPTNTNGYLVVGRRNPNPEIGYADEYGLWFDNTGAPNVVPCNDTYGDDPTVYARVYDLEDAELNIIVGAEGGEEPPVEVNKDALATAIATTPAVAQANATSASWTAYTTALAAAEAVYANADATQDDVDTATTALLAAIDGVTALGTCSYAPLNSILGEYADYNEADYTTASWAPVAAAYAAAIAIEPNLVNDEEGVNQARITAAADALANALGDLVARGDKDALQTAVTNAPAVTTADVTAASYNALQAALTAANTVLDNIDATQADVDAALNNLNAAINGLVYLSGCNYTALNAAKDAYNALDLDAYTPASRTASGVEAAYTAACAIAADLVNDEAGTNQKSIDDAAAALNTAIDALVLKANKDALAAAITTTPAYEAEEATSASWAAYEDALAAAQTVNADENATQNDVETATEALLAAIEEVTFLGYCEYDALNEAVAAFEALDLDDYTPASVTDSDVETFYEEAKALAVAATKLIADEDDFNQEIIDTAADNLGTAIGELVLRANFAALNAKIAAAQAYTADSYTPASWTEADLANVITAAQAVAANANATQAAVNAQIELIDAAIAKLVATADKTALLAKIDEASALVEANYTPASWTDAALADAIADAQAVYEDADATNEAVAAQITALNTAIAKLIAKADKTDLEEAIATTPAVTQADATTASWEAYETALAAAQTVYDNADATQNAVDEAETALRAAIANVTSLAGCDYDALDAAIDEYDALDLDDYTPASRTTSGVETAYAAAKAIDRNLLADEEGEHQAIINEAAAALAEAIDALVLKANKDALADAIATTPAYAQNEATSDSWRNYTAALDWANGVYAEDNATQTAVNNAEEMLREAIALVTFLGYCDYDELNAAKAAYNALDLGAYTPISVTVSDVEAAYTAATEIAADLINDEAGANQAAINDAAAALAEAIDALVLKADKAALAEAIAADPSIIEDNATDASWNAYAEALDAAQAVYADDNASQGDVDTARETLVNANADLYSRGLCDYDALNSAIAAEPAAEQSEYTAASWTAYADALAAAQAIATDLIDNKAGTNQDMIDAAEEALVDAFNALKINASNILAVEADLSDYYQKGSRTYNVKVNGAASKIQITDANGVTVTFDRYSTKATIVSYNADGAVVNYEDEEPAYEIWTFTLTLAEGDYTLRAKYGKTWDTELFDYAVEYATYVPTTTFAAKVFGSDDDYGTSLAFDGASRGRAEFRVVTPDDVTKIQLVTAGGAATTTYTAATKAVADGNGNLVWTVARGVTTGDGAEIVLKVKTAYGWQAADCDAIAVSFAAAE